jgi:UbiD family decarboxylase
MPVADLREWIQKTEARGDLRRIKGADVHSEIGAITNLYQRQPGLPALLFEDIPGYPEGFRVCSNSLASFARIAATLEMDPASTPLEIVAKWRKTMTEVKPIPANVVKTGPVMENVLLGDDINVLKFPTPKWHELDGGYYIGTGDMILTKDPDTDWVNSGTYRVMVHDEKHTALMISPGKHGRMIREKYWAKGQPCPVVVVAGQDPLLYMVSGMEVPYGVTEYDFAGAIRGKAIDVINGPTTGLPIPATAEIAIEGMLYPDNWRDEGPFGEWTGYYAGATRPEPQITVTAILHRNQPIILGSSPSVPPSDTAFFRSPLRSAIVWNQLEGAGIPGIKGVWAHEAGGGRLLLIVAVKQMYPGHSRQAGLVASQCHGGAYTNRWVVVVDEDVDITDTNQWLWATLTRCDPVEDVEILRKCWSTHLDPLAYPLDKGRYFNNRMIFDACRSFERKDTFPPVVVVSPRDEANAKAKWPELFTTDSGYRL